MANTMPMKSITKIMMRYLSTNTLDKKTIYLFNIETTHEQDPRTDWLCANWRNGLFVFGHDRQPASMASLLGMCRRRACHHFVSEIKTEKNSNMRSEIV